MSTDNRTLCNGVLRPKLLNNPSASCFFTNLDFLIQYTEHFDCIINLLFFVSKIFESKFLVCFYTLYNKSAFIIWILC